MKLKLFFLPITLILSLVLVIWFIKPGWVEYKIRNAELSDLLSEKQQFEKGLAQLNAALDDYELMNEDTKQLIMNAVPGEKSNDDFIAEIHKNVMGAGVFLSGTKFREDRGAQVKKKGQALVATKTEVEIEVIGSYLNVKSFVDRVDLENRLSTPKEIEISRLRSQSVSEDETGPADLVRARIIFGIYEKKKDSNTDLSSLSNTGDKVVKSLLESGLKMQVIDNYKEAVTATVFVPVSMGDAGKQDIFAN